MLWSFLKVRLPLAAVAVAAEAERGGGARGGRRAAEAELLRSQRRRANSRGARGATSGRDNSAGRTAQRGGRGARGAGAPPANIPAHCRVQMVLKPTSDSLIKMELWLPTQNWNGKFMGVGNGGFAGSIQGLGGDMPQATTPRIRHRRHRHRSSGAGRRLGDWPSRENDRLRLSLDA